MPRRLKSLFSRLTKRKSTSARTSEQQQQSPAASTAPTNGSSNSYSNSSSSSSSSSSNSGNASVSTTATGRPGVAQESTNVVYRQLAGSRFAENLATNARRARRAASPPVSPTALAEAFSSTSSYSYTTTSTTTRTTAAAAAAAAAAQRPQPPPVSRVDLAAALSASLAPSGLSEIPEYNDDNAPPLDDDDGPVPGTPPPLYLEFDPVALQQSLMWTGGWSLDPAAGLWM